jgi:GDP-L-fucose synthase
MCVEMVANDLKAARPAEGAWVGNTCELRMTDATKIYIAGHRGMVGGAIMRQLQARQNAGEALVLMTRTSGELDLTDQVAVRDFMQAETPDVVILAAAKVGGIIANNT